ncbi:hypothetical protein LOTGIDRAFT_158585 [Lottia gigantea]|uniref:Uncharacterized protein n=1 Tax=Lottia gigantea TaxID=225164 RepID=V4A6F5_LOTGI|nr:hypothetical protein LOTGIDRAFT_158585 [Lottia gigantea]ESO99493.1 hypothetical protein LOTGIDRAFT_158585 [Lottia gigantea]
MRAITRNTIERVGRAVRDDIDLERIDANAKECGFLPFVPLIFAGLTAAGAIAGGTAIVVSAANDDKAAKVKAAEEHRYNLEMEKQAHKAATVKKSSGVADILGTVKEFVKRFGEETKKTVKQIN